jgi:hypothetical protein
MLKQFLILLAASMIGQVALAQPIKSPTEAFPDYETIVHAFYSRYKGAIEPQFDLQKRSTGWHIQYTGSMSDSLSAAWLFWSAKTQQYQATQPMPTKKGNEPAVPFYVSDTSEMIRTYIAMHPYEARESGYFPYYGYRGWYFDVVKCYEPHLKDLTDDQLHALGRAYHACCDDVFFGFVVEISASGQPLQYPLPPGLNALSPAHLERFKYWQERSIAAYQSLSERNPAYKTFVGSIRTKWSTEFMSAFTLMQMYQNEEEARKWLKPDLFDPFMLQSAREMLLSCPQDAILFTYGDNDTYSALYVQAMEGYRPDVIVMSHSLAVLGRYYHATRSGMFGAKPLKTLLTGDLKHQSLFLSTPEEPDEPVLYNDFFGRLNTDQPKNLTSYPASPSHNPYRSMHLDVSRIVLPAAPAHLTYGGKTIEKPTLSRRIRYPMALSMQDIVVLDIICANQWERPVCFSITCQGYDLNHWANHLAMEGWIYRVYPDVFESPDRMPYFVNVDQGAINFAAYQAEHLAYSISEHQPFATCLIASGCYTAEKQIKLGNVRSAISTLQKIEQKLPKATYGRTDNWIYVCKLYAQCGQTAAAEQVGLDVLDYYERLEEPDDDYDESDIRSQLLTLAQQYKLKKLQKRLN